MEPRPADGNEDRVLVLAPTGRDAVLTCEILDRAGFQAFPCPSAQELCREIGLGAGVAVLADEALNPYTINGLIDVLGSQGPWSDLPLIVFTRRASSDDVLTTLAPLGNSTLLERPVRVTTLISSVDAALRARKRQYEVRDLLRRQAEADRRKDEFLAMLGHELRNPLAAIRNALSVLDRMGDPGEVAVRQRQVIGRQTRHLARMVDDLLDVSRVTQGKIALQLQPVDLQEVVERCLRELGSAQQAEQHRLELSSEAEPVMVEGDAVRLEQVISNLLHNAIKYTPPGGTIAVTVRADDGEAVVCVRDSGIGIPAEMLPRIFELFTQVESSLPRAQGGLGLGLPLVRSLVELHGGSVAAASGGPGAGSEFVVRLPRSAAGTRRPRRIAQRGVRSIVQGMTVLVIEDNTDGRESLRDLLEIWGHRVELAADGLTGVEQALTGTVDVALIDIGLPGIDGNEVARRIRAGQGSEGLRLIAMTGYGQPEDRRRALAAGFDYFLVKPVDPGELARLLAQAWRQSDRQGDGGGERRDGPHGQEEVAHGARVR